MRVAVVGKGGAGKSVIAGTMARLLARRGQRVLALDSDPMWVQSQVHEDRGTAAIRTVSTVEVATDQVATDGLSEGVLEASASWPGPRLRLAALMLDEIVTLIEAADRPLAREDPFAGDQVQESLLEQGVEVRCDSKVVVVQRADDGELTIEIDGAPEVRADELLVAVGRRPHTDDAGLETVGLEPGR